MALRRTPPEDLQGPRRGLHFVGISGIGMSGLAHLCVSEGLTVSGCDSKLNTVSRRLRERGVRISVGHSAEHVSGELDLVVYSSAVPADQPELCAARARGLPVITRGALLARLSEHARLIGVAGAHGKTTTSAMAGELLVRAGWDPAVVIGGMVRTWGSNARWGRGRFLVAETDESDGSFLLLHPEVAIITNIDREHLNYYREFDALLDAFAQFTSQVPHGGLLIRCADDPWVRDLPSHRREIQYGFDPSADVTLSDLEFEGHASRFRASFRGRSLGAFSLQVPGRHNAQNALSVIALGLALELPLTTVRDTLAAFRGTERRFQLSRLPGDIWLIEDYAHHPAEIRATLNADPIYGRHRLVVFQPHRFSRTQLLEQEFAGCFDRADGLIVTDIYPAFEAPIPGVSGARLAELIKARGHPCVRYVPRQELTGYLKRVAQPGDTVFFLGAGDIGEVCHAMARGLRLARPAAC